ncbi:MAG: glucosidase, partial [Myxococcales bacterium]|nr:glucosidase [Myxococcales bacterium]
QWGTVREDYSDNGDAWNYLPHDHARSRAYRWGEDGLAGISDDKNRLCFALALWNGRDAILKERLFGLTNSQGNHGEDVKEYYFFLDNTPTHSWMRWLYKYPQAAYPYSDLVNTNAARGKQDFEYELIDTGVFDGDRYFDVQVDYAKAGPEDICVCITIHNRAPEPSTIDVLPTLWFRNQWSWKGTQAPTLVGDAGGPVATVKTSGTDLSSEDGYGAPMTLYCDGPQALYFVDNETNQARLWGSQPSPRYPKDGINDHVVAGADTVNPALTGSKASAHWRVAIDAGGSATVRLRLSADSALSDPFGATYAATLADRQAEADAYYGDLIPSGLDDDRKAIMRQAYAGMLWSKQFYSYAVRTWLDGDPAQPKPPPGHNRNQDWQHFFASNILTMPDTWEYPWFAQWDLCFQSVVFSRLDPTFAKNQLLVLAREWFMSPAGAIPAYEWNFSDVNPPLHAWASLRVFEHEQAATGGAGDLGFLEAMFRYCLLYFAWWANRKDLEGGDVFTGGFLGLDNISIVDRSSLKTLGDQINKDLELGQSDGTSWMGMFCLNMMDMALRLRQTGEAEYDRLAIKFFQHFVFITDAINGTVHDGGQPFAIWDDADRFYYDVLKVSDRHDPKHTCYQQIKLRSLVGVIALFPCYILDVDALEASTHAGLLSRIEWFSSVHPELLDQATVSDAGGGNRRLLSFVDPERLSQILRWVLDEAEFLSPHGVRGLSKAYQTPYTLQVEGQTLSENYEPAESTTYDFGGNSNWRGPVWFPINFLLIETLARFHRFVGDGYTVEHPHGSGAQKTLREVADDLTERMIAIFTRGADGNRPVFGGNQTFQQDPHWKDHILFYEYFHGDNGAGLGASHQTGWTGLITELLRGVTG